MAAAVTEDVVQQLETKWLAPRDVAPLLEALNRLEPSHLRASVVRLTHLCLDIATFCDPLCNDFGANAVRLILARRAIEQQADQFLQYLNAVGTELVALRAEPLTATEAAWRMRLLLVVGAQRNLLRTTLMMLGRSLWWAWP